MFFLVPFYKKKGSCFLITLLMKYAKKECLECHHLYIKWPRLG